MEKLDVYFYGNKKTEVINTKTCGLSQVPGRDATEYEVYKDLESFLLSTDIKDKINLKFIDIEEHVIDNDEKINELLEKYKTPIISLDNKEYFVGKEHNVNVYIKIKNMLKNR